MSWSDPCSNCGAHRADCDCGDWNGYKQKGKIKIMNTTNQPVFPVNDSNSGETGATGLTKREYFAATAGNAPDWFEHIKEERNFSEVPDYRNIDDKEHKNILESWLRDGCFDLPEELQWFADAYEKRQKEENEYRKRDTLSRYFQWKTFYADQLLTQLSKP